MPEATQPVRTETQVSLPPTQMRSTNTCCFQSQYIFVGSNIPLWTSCGKQNPYLPIRNCNPLTSMKGNVTLMALKLPRIHLYHYDYLSIFLSALLCERFEIRDCVFSQSLSKCELNNCPLRGAVLDLGCSTASVLATAPAHCGVCGRSVSVLLGLWTHS